MSAAKLAASSAMPRSRWKRVPAAGISPAERLVEPRGTGSRSITSGSTPAARQASAATSPAAPAPMMATGTSVAKDGAASVTTRASLIRESPAPSPRC
jgi:hypothetical protein